MTISHLIVGLVVQFGALSLKTITSIKTITTILAILFIFGTVLPVQTPMNMATTDTVVERNNIAADTLNQFTMEMGWAIPFRTYDYVSWSLQASDGVYGSFVVTSPSTGDDQIVDFAIMDSTNFALFEDGQSASGYHLVQNRASYSFEFKVPSTGTWYFINVNHNPIMSKTAVLDLYRDTTPPEIDMNLNEGEVCSGTETISATITEETFNVGTVTLYIDGDFVRTYSGSFSYSWDTTDYANGDVQVRIVASDDVGNTGYEVVVVSVSNSIFPGLGGGGDNPAMLMDTVIIGSIGFVVLIGIGFVIVRRRGSGDLPIGLPSDSPPLEPVSDIPPSDDEPVSHVEQQKPDISTEPQPPSDDQTPPTDDGQIQPRFCSSCGKGPMPPGTKFCPSCGASFG